MGENQNNTSLDIAQVRNIVNDDCIIAQDVIIDLLEMVGAMSVDDYHNITGISKRTIQDRLKKGNMSFVPVAGMRFPCINM